MEPFQVADRAQPVCRHDSVSRHDIAALLSQVAAGVFDRNAGIFGPDSLSWRINRESALFLGAGRAALLQLAHPWVVAALRQHSSLLNQPIARFHNTFRFVFTMVFGTLDQALAAARHLYALHTALPASWPKTPPHGSAATVTKPTKSTRFDGCLPRSSKARYSHTKASLGLCHGRIASDTTRKRRPSLRCLESPLHHCPPTSKTSPPISAQCVKPASHPAHSASPPTPAPWPTICSLARAHLSGHLAGIGPSPQAGFLRVFAKSSACTLALPSSFPRIAQCDESPPSTAGCRHRSVARGAGSPLQSPPGTDRPVEQSLMDWRRANAV
ncbi:MAG: oxygenase MpaB family protein [Terracidiphilus sp.]